MPLATLGYTLGRILVLFAGFFLLPVLVAAGYGERQATMAFVAGAILTAFAGGILIFTYRGVGGEPTKRDLVILPLIGWLTGAFFAGVPMALAGAVPTLGAGFFEGLSGLTTTGATIIDDVDGAPRAVLMWRATLQWLGGIAALAFAIAIAPALDLGGARLLNVALPHGEGGTLTERLRGVAQPLLPIYGFLTLIAAILYWAAGMPLFDSVCHAMSTLSSGGFSTRTDSLAAFNAPMVELVAVPFMFLAATNFTYHWAFLRGRRQLYLRDPEVRLLVLLFLVGALVVFTGDLAQSHFTESGRDVLRSLRIALMTASSAASTTGFVGSGEIPLTLLGVFTVCALLFVGGGMGSTAAGIKALRLLLLLRHAASELARLAHPSGITRLHYLHKRVSDHSLHGVWIIYFLFLASLAVMTVGFTSTGSGLALSFYLALTALSNAGPIIHALSPDFGGFSTLDGDARTLYAAGMIIGRLEIITFFALLAPALWRR